MGELTFKVVSMMGWSAATAIRMAQRYGQTESYPETGFWEVRRGRRSVTGIHNGPLLENARQPARDRAGTP